MSEERESHMLKRYELIKKQGKGAYGIVYKKREKKAKEIFALKKNLILLKCNRLKKEHAGK